MAAINIPDKVCPHCNGTKWVVHNEKRPTVAEPDRIYIRYRCAVLSQARKKRWNEKNQDYIKTYTKERDIKRRAEGYWTTPKMQAYFRAKAKEYRDNYTDYYITTLWRKKKEHRDYILTPQEVAIYKEYLLIHRQIKTSTHGKESKTNRH